MNKTTDLWKKVKEEVNAMSIEPIREFLDVKENRRGYFGSMGKAGIGDYYCIPIDVLIKCGISVDELFQGKTAIEEQEWRRNHLCSVGEEMASSLDENELCSTCAGIRKARQD